MGKMGALKHAVQLILHSGALRAAPRACPSSPGNARPYVAQALNVHVMRISAQIDEADEVVVWNVITADAWCTGPGVPICWQVSPKVGVVHTQGDIVAGCCAWVSVQVSCPELRPAHTV